MIFIFHFEWRQHFNAKGDTLFVFGYFSREWQMPEKLLK